MSAPYKSRALVLFRRSCGEADEIVGLLTPKRGRVDVIVRGSKRVNSELIGKLEPFVEFEGQFVPGKKWSYLTQAALVRPRPGLEGDYARLCWGSLFLEMWAKAVPENHPAEDEYRYLACLLDGLERAQRFRLVACWAEWNLARLLGFAPQLRVCASCGAPRQVGFSLEAGGVICASCRARAGEREGGQLLSVRLLLLLSRVPYLTLEKAIEVELERVELRQLEAVLWSHWCYCQQHRWRSRHLVDNLD